MIFKTSLGFSIYLIPIFTRTKSTSSIITEVPHVNFLQFRDRKSVSCPEEIVGYSAQALTCAVLEGVLICQLLVGLRKWLRLAIRGDDAHRLLLFQSEIHRNLRCLKTRYCYWYWCHCCCCYCFRSEPQLTLA